MLQAELAGHALPEALASEDYLTSTVFGLLKYVDSHHFWDDLFLRAVLVGPRGERVYRQSRFAESGQAEAVEACFWHRYDDAIPDLTVLSHKHGQVLVRVLIEVKLNAEKSEAGDSELDQLVRYARVAARLSTSGAPTFLIFLTRGDPVPDIQESLGLLNNEPDTGARIFGLQWGDLHAACLETCHSAFATKIERRILHDLVAYLRKRNLDHFSGFRRLILPEFSLRPLLCSSGEPLLKRVPLPDIIEIKRIFAHGNE